MLKQNRAFMLFVKTFSIAAAVMLLAGGIGWLAVNNAVRPPDIPVIAAGGAVFDVGDDEGYDVDGELDDELLPPQLAQFEERKPMFFTFLIFGLTEGLNANTIMVAAYDAEAQQGYIISIPRDTLVDVQRNSRKIVSAYPVGRLHGGGHEGGVERMKYEVSTLIGFRPDFYVRVDYEAFIRMVDAVGGVEIYIPFRMYYHDPFQDLRIDLQAGLQTLDGEDALRFARYRTGTPGISPTISDYQRIEHQQQVLAAVASQLLTPASILQIPEFVGIFNDHVYSDLAMGELLWFANQAINIGGTEALHTYTLPMLGTSGAPYWYELADEEGILELINRTINPLVRDITAEDLRIVQ
ncbi:MAG: LCP family protein [Defluviitaleaceae bacterium]|nr:LCP family protein [Defluviitaleaceae bacterium]